ncbi:MAG TPA: hypothetical protein VK914_11150 [bacterium]|jgi:hypothetical protein|nr:hypothetical protein [bacterium]
MAIVEESEFKGNPMIVLRRNPEDRYPFQFGLSKAKLVLEALEEIKAWVAKQEASRTKDAPSPDA